MCLSLAIARPDDVLARGEHAGFEWMVIHNGIGYRCGYVKLPPSHPWFGKADSDLDVSVHGGITFSEHDVACGAGGPDDGYWIGFDCAHGFDAPDPTLPNTRFDNMLASTFQKLYGDSEIRTQEYVEAECRSLCDQAAAASITLS